MSEFEVRQAERAANEATVAWALHDSVCRQWTADRYCLKCRQLSDDEIAAGRRWRALLREFEQQPAGAR